MEVNMYKDFDRNQVKIGDNIAWVDLITGQNIKVLGKVTKIVKKGYIVTPWTEQTGARAYIPGRYTRKI